MLSFSLKLVHWSSISIENLIISLASYDHNWPIQNVNLTGLFLLRVRMCVAQHRKLDERSEQTVNKWQGAQLEKPCPLEDEKLAKYLLSQRAACGQQQRKQLS